MRIILLSRIGLVLVVAVLCFPAVSYLMTSQPSTMWQVLTEGKHPHNLPFDSIKFFDSSNGINLTALTVNRTTDGGRTWTTTLDYNNMGFYSLVFTDQTDGWIAGTEVKKTPDAEESREANASTRKPVILETNDRGLDWRKIYVDESSLTSKDARFSTFLDICFDKSGKSWIVGDGGVVEGRIENETLKVLDVTYTKDSLNSVTCDESGKVWAVGDAGRVMHFQNSWKEMSLNEDAFFKKVRTIGSDIWLIGGTRAPNEEKIKGLLLRSRDDGQTWEDKTPSLANGLFDLYLNKNQGWLVGAAGTIFHTTDGGQTWQREKSPTNNDLMTVFFLNSYQGWIGGGRLTVLRLFE